MEILGNSQFLNQEWAAVYENFKIEKLQLLGEGTFSKCFLFKCSKQHQKKYYVGKIFKRPRQLDHDVFEFECKVAHENIAGLKGIFVFNELSYCRVYDMYYRDLFGLKIKNENQFFTIAYGIKRALEYLHNICKIVHCDVKPCNIMLKDKETYNIVLIDFDESIPIDQIKQYNLQVVIEYRHPDLFKSLSNWDQRVDNYAAACVLYELHTGELFCPNEIKYIKQLEQYNYITSFIHFKLANCNTNCLEYIKNEFLASI